MKEKNRNSKNKFKLEGNVASISNIYTNTNGKQTLRFDLAQNNNGNTQFVPIVLKGELVNSYGNVIQKGNWVSINGRISTYVKIVEKDGKTYKEKMIDIIGFEITDRTNNKVYTSDGHVRELSNEKEPKNDFEMER